MSRILVLGGTGLAGREVVRACVGRGLDTRTFSRRGSPGSAHDGVEHVRGDVTTGVGLSQAMAGVDVVIDTLDGKFGRARGALSSGARNIAPAAAAAGVQRMILLSIVNVDQVSFGYYRAKANQERIYRSGPVECSVVRCTQFHDLVTGVFDAGRKVRATPRFRGARFQTISTADAAASLVDAAVAPGLRDVTVGGPEILGMDVMARIYRQFTGARGPVIAVPVPGALGRYWRGGLNLVPENSVRGTTYAEWLEERELPGNG